jgi:hypothetical protein
MEHAPVAFDARRHNFLSYWPAIDPSELDKLIKPADRLEEGVGQLVRESGPLPYCRPFR